jgi:hypothetical protein
VNLLYADASNRPRRAPPPIPHALQKGTHFRKLRFAFRPPTPSSSSSPHLTHSLPACPLAAPAGAEEKGSVRELAPMAAATPYQQVMEDMLRGRDFAAQLQDLLRDSPKAGLIVDQILRAFSRAIDAAKAVATEEGSEVQSEVTCAGGDRKRKATTGAAGRASRRR